MAEVGSNQKAAEVFKLYFETKSPVIVTHMMQKKYPEDERVTKLQVHLLFYKFQQTESVEYSQHNTVAILKGDLTPLKHKMSVTLNM